MDQVEKQAAQRQERLDTDLHGFKTNLIKESIRMGHTDLGDFFYNKGDLQVRALQCTEAAAVHDTCSNMSQCLNVEGSHVRRIMAVRWTWLNM